MLKHDTEDPVPHDIEDWPDVVIPVYGRIKEGANYWHRIDESYVRTSFN